MPARRRAAPAKLFVPDGCGHEARSAASAGRIHDKTRPHGANWPEGAPERQYEQNDGYAGIVRIQSPERPAVSDKGGRTRPASSGQAAMQRRQGHATERPYLLVNRCASTAGTASVVDGKMPETACSQAQRAPRTARSGGTLVADQIPFSAQQERPIAQPRSGTAIAWLIPPHRNALARNAPLERAMRGSEA